VARARASRRQNDAAQTRVAPRRSSRRRSLIWIAGGLAVVALAVVGRQFVGQWCRRQASRDLDAWAIADAQKWLDRADRIDWRDPATQLLRATCFRLLKDIPRRDAALALASAYGASLAAVESERTLGRIQSGELGEEASRRFDELLAAGISSDQITGAYIGSAIARRNLPLAKRLADVWASDAPSHPHIFFLQGVLRALADDPSGARAAYQQALAIESRHELAALALAEMEEADGQFDAAVDRLLPLAEAHPENVMIVPGFARALRKTGRQAEANWLLAPLAADPAAPTSVTFEMFSIELESGDYRAARGWLERVVAATRPQDDGTLTAAAVTLSMLGETMAAENLFSWVFDRTAALSHVDDLRSYVAVNPRDQAAADQLQQRLSQLATQKASENPYAIARAQAAAQQARETPAKRLYLQHCAACHGTQGDGTGIAARHVFPRPLNLRGEPVRLVSTRNGIPTPTDIRTAIRDGVPGTSMVPLETLTEADLDLLVELVLQLRREGIRQQYVAQVVADGEEPDEEDVNEVVALRTTPGEVVAAPVLGAPDQQSLARGKRLYVDQACQSCHGETGVGDQLMPLFDTAGRPAFPRDLVHDAFKGGNEPGAIYLRILLGMPGTPHPANVSMTADELADVSYYCHSLGQAPKRALTNHQRAIQASRRPAVQW